MDLTPLYKIELLLAGILFFLSFLLFALTPWYKSATGKALFLVLFGLSLVLALVTGSFLFGPYEHRELARLIVYSTVLLISVIVFTFCVAVQVEGSKRRSRKNVGVTYTGADHQD